MNYSAQIHRNIQRLTRAQQLERSMDRQFFTILCRATNGNIYTEERVLTHEDEQKVIDDIASGAVGDVQVIFASNPIEHTCDLITEDIARKILVKYGVESHTREFLEDQLGCLVVAEAEREWA